MLLDYCSTAENYLTALLEKKMVISNFIKEDEDKRGDALDAMLEHDDTVIEANKRVEELFKKLLG